MNMTTSARIIALVGMPGSGKSEVAAVFASHGFARIRFGDVTDEQVKQRGLVLNEQNERLVREGLRKEYGMAAYAILSLQRIENAVAKGNVVIDGLYSWEEYKFLREKLEDKLILVEVWAPPALRYQRLSTRPVRPLTAGQARSRDYAEIENVNKGGPIAMADHTINNTSSLEELVRQTAAIIEVMR